MGKSNYAKLRKYVEGFFDVFDAIFTIRDVVVHGDIAALGFLAFDILVPVIGDAVMSIRRSAKGAKYLSPDVMDIVEGMENAEDIISRNLGARNMNDFVNDQHRGLGKLADETSYVTREELDNVIKHLGSEWIDNGLDDPANQAMIKRLESALENGTPISGADLSFYRHELAEAEILDDIVKRDPKISDLVNDDYPLNWIVYDEEKIKQIIENNLLDIPSSELPSDIRRSILYNYAHEKSLDQYNVSRYSVYHPDVLEATREYWSNVYFEFWKNLKK